MSNLVKLDLVLFEKPELIHLLIPKCEKMNFENLLIVNVAAIFISLKLLVKFPVSAILLTTTFFAVSLCLSAACVILFPRRDPYRTIPTLDAVNNIAQMLFWGGCIALFVLKNYD